MTVSFGAGANRSGPGARSLTRFCQTVRGRRPAPGQPTMRRDAEDGAQDETPRAAGPGGDGAPAADVRGSDRPDRDPRLRVPARADLDLPEHLEQAALTADRASGRADDACGRPATPARRDGWHLRPDPPRPPRRRQ